MKPEYYRIDEVKYIKPELKISQSRIKKEIKFNLFLHDLFCTEDL